MNVEIWTEAEQFPEKEYINGIFDAVYWEKEMVKKMEMAREMEMERGGEGDTEMYRTEEWKPRIVFWLRTVRWTNRWCA